MKYCTKCGASNSNAAQFCIKCGAKIKVQSNLAGDGKAGSLPAVPAKANQKNPPLPSDASSVSVPRKTAWGWIITTIIAVIVIGTAFGLGVHYFHGREKDASPASAAVVESLRGHFTCVTFGGKKIATSMGDMILTETNFHLEFDADKLFFNNNCEGKPSGVIANLVAIGRQDFKNAKITLFEHGGVKEGNIYSEKYGIIAIRDLSGNHAGMFTASLTEAGVAAIKQALQTNALSQSLVTPAPSPEAPPDGPRGIGVSPGMPLPGTPMAPPNSMPGLPPMPAPPGAGTQPFAMEASPNVEADETLVALRARAEKGDAVAQNQLGDSYANNDAVLDYSEAVKWFRQAADQGLAIAQFNLAACYANGRGFDRNTTEAANWFRKSADQGLPQAQYSLGLLYKSGAGVVKDLPTAYGWFVLAAAAGHDQAPSEVSWLEQRISPVKAQEAGTWAKTWKAVVVLQPATNSVAVKTNPGIYLPAGPRVALLVQKTAALDADEDNLRQFLIASRIPFTLVDVKMIKTGRIILDSFNVLYIRTGAEPTGYNDPEVISKIQARIQGGAKLVMEYFGLYLGQYLGVGSASTGSWMPMVTDGMYFVKPIDNSALLQNLPVWDPPSLPDKPAQLIARLKSPGFYKSVNFTFKEKSTTKSFLVLATTYGFSGQNAASAYCRQHPGLCTSERWVTETAGLSGEKPLGIGFIPFGKGKIFMPKVGHINQVPADHLNIGPIANAIRVNIIKSAAASSI